MLYYHAVLTGFGVVAIATGFGGCVWSIVRGFRSASWPSVAGEVTDASMDVSWGRGTKLCTPQIRYRYRVDGSDYEGARVFFGWDAFYTESGARKIVERYRPGEPVDALQSDHAHFLSSQNWSQYPHLACRGVLWYASNPLHRRALEDLEMMMRGGRLTRA